MNKGKYQVIGAVVKQSKPFKAVVINQLTGLSRQLCFKHLSSLVTDGFLEKDGMYYCVVDRPGMIDALTDLSEQKGVELLTTPRAYIGDIPTINKHIETAVLFRNAKLPGYQELVKFYQNGIDDTITDLKKLKRYLNSKQIDQKKALVQLENTLGARWPLVNNVMLEQGITSSRTDTTINELLNEMEDK